MERFLRLVSAQGGRLDPSRSDFGLPVAPLREVVAAERAGAVAGIDPLALGYGVIALGGGRRRQNQEIDPGVGFEIEVGVGERVTGDTPLAVVHAATTDGVAAGVRAVREAICLEADPAPEPLPLVIDRIRTAPGSATRPGGRGFPSVYREREQGGSRQ